MSSVKSKAWFASSYLAQYRDFVNLQKFNVNIIILNKHNNRQPKWFFTTNHKQQQKRITKQTN